MLSFVRPIIYFLCIAKYAAEVDYLICLYINWYKLTYFFKFILFGKDNLKYKITYAIRS